jgi:hypothetical protein
MFSLSDSMNAESPNRLTIEGIYVDGSMVELETFFHFRRWSARATAYTQFKDLALFANQLERFAETLAGEAIFVAGDENSSVGFLALRFYPIGRTGRFACHLRLATNAASDSRPEEIWRVSAELKSTAAALDRFLEGMRCIGGYEGAKATLCLEE